MSLTLETFAEIAALGLAAWAVLRSIPRPPTLDWERLFKVSLSTVLMGDIEARKGSRADWVERVSALVPYHPAARDPQTKLLHPDPAALPTPALDGERALVESLARLPDPAARWRRMFVEDERAREVLFSDPEELGPDYDAARALGKDAGWSAVAAWSSPVTTGLQRRFSHVVTLVLCADPRGRGLGAALGAASGLRSVALDVDPSPDLAGAPTPLLQRLAEAVSASSDRIVLVGIGAGALVAVHALQSSPELRDRTLAVVALGGALGTAREAQDWMAAHFTQEALDTEINRFTHYFSVPLVDPAAEGGLEAVDWAGQHWPSPAPAKGGGRTPVLPVALGPIPPCWLETDAERALLARALWVVLAFVLSQG